MWVLDSSIVEREREREIICEMKLIIKKKKNCERKLPPAQMIIT
jgi:hypothetical protein